MHVKFILPCIHHCCYTGSFNRLQKVQQFAFATCQVRNTVPQKPILRNAKKNPTLFRIQTQHLLPHTASPFPHRHSSHSAYHSGTNLAQNPKEAAAAAMVSVYKYKSRLGRWWKRRRWDNKEGGSLCTPYSKLCQVPANYNHLLHI